MLALLQAVEILESASVWEHGDDLCDCTFQRIGNWYNPYLGEMLEVRLCCIWAEIYKQYPQFVRIFSTDPAEWNGESDMPKALWYRQQAKVRGVPLAEVRELGLPSPKGQPRMPQRRSLLGRLFHRE